MPTAVQAISAAKVKTDSVDAATLAQLLRVDMIPEAHRATPRQRQHRRLVRQRVYLHKRITSVRSKIRWILTDYNADRSDLFTAEGLKYLAQVKVSQTDRFVLDQLIEEWEFHVRRLQGLDKELSRFAQSASPAETEARAVLESIPYVGPVTIDAVISELGDVRRFRSQKKATAYAGLAPGRRESAGRARTTSRRPR